MYYCSVMKKEENKYGSKIIYLGYFLFYAVVILGVAKCSSDQTKESHQPSWLGTGVTMLSSLLWNLYYKFG